jgi:hypothetical protein
LRPLRLQVGAGRDLLRTLSFFSFDHPFPATYTESVAGKITPTVAPGSKDVRKEASNLDTSDEALAALLNRLKAAVDPNEIRQLSDQIERVVFHKQFTDG